MFEEIKSEHGADLTTLLDKYNGSTDVVLLEYFQDARKFVDGDIIKIIDSNTGEVVQQFIYDMDTDIRLVMRGN